jgi:hypothetical protein
MATTVERVPDVTQELRAPVEAQRKRIEPVSIWAVVGAAILVFMIYVWGKWITGPDFKAVGVGSHAPPGWIKASVITFEIVGWPTVLAAIYYFLVRPWRRERRVTTDGLLVGVWLSLYFQDPLSSYFGNWFTYNSYAFNRGSWVADMPGWMSFAKPGHMLVEPFLWALPGYIYGLFMGTIVCCWAMRKVENRFAGIHPIALCAFAWAFMIVADVLLEGVAWMHFGLYTYSGGHVQILGNHWYKYPLSEGVLWGFAWAMLACLRYFKDDQGHTLAERGIDKIKGGTTKKTAIRFLALLGMFQVAYFVTFTLPCSVLVGAKSATWPKTAQNTPWLNDGICGAGTDRACPGPNVPLSKPGSAYLGRNGQLVVPTGATLPHP